MSANRRMAASRHGRSDGSFWLSFSDLMSSLVLIIILVMFYIIYQYFNLAEINQAEIARRQFQLDQAQTELESQQSKLTEAEEKMIAQQILLNAKQAELDDAQSVLEAQKSELAATQTQLGEKEAEIAAQQAQMDALGIELSNQQQQLDSQQQQLEQLVGMKTRIITSLSTALKDNSISASVDPANGSIALESDVLFDSGEFGLSARGEEFIAKFLPIYLDVLFSDEYKDYVAEVIIEGHTDSDGGYLENLKLSQQRALAVASHVLSDGYRGISGSEKRALREVLTVNGRSYSDRILDENGREDKEASRRVVFKFRLTDEQMIQQLRDILEAQ